VDRIERRSWRLGGRTAAALATVVLTVMATFVAGKPAYASDTCRILASTSNTNGAFFWADCRTSSPNAPYWYRAYIGCWAANRSPDLLTRYGLWRHSSQGGWSQAYCQQHETRLFQGVEK